MTWGAVRPALGLALAAALAAGCARSDDPGPGAPTTTAAPTTAAAPPTAAPTTAAPTTATTRAPTTTGATAPTPTTAGSTVPDAIRCNDRRTGGAGGFMNLVAVRAGTHGGYDRVVFEFEAPASYPGGNPPTLPDFRIFDVQPPLREDPSDRVLRVEGEVFREIVFQGSTSVYTFDARGEQVILPDTVPERVPARFEVLREVVEGGDFEAVQSWYLGLSRSTCFRVLELADPPRVVVDFAH